LPGLTSQTRLVGVALAQAPGVRIVPHRPQPEDGARNTQEPGFWLTAHPLADPLPRSEEGAYERLERLGAGGMGVVYRAFDPRLKRLVALKMLTAGLFEPRRLALVRREAEALARLQHPHIVQVHALAGGAEGPMIVLEYVPGGTLEERLAHQRPSPGEAARLVAILARAVQAAHDAGVIHRDLKPGNVLMAPPVEGSGDNVLGGFPKVADFGLARLAEADVGATAAGAVQGTPAYMAPEQADGKTLLIGPKADVWALGVILYRCLTGRRPFLGASVVEVLDRIRTQPPPPLTDAGVPARLETICLACLDKDPACRPTAADLARRLEQFLEEVPAPGRTAGESTGEATAVQPIQPTGGGPGWRWAFALLLVAAAGPLVVARLWPAPERRGGPGGGERAALAAVLRVLHFPGGEARPPAGSAPTCRRATSATASASRWSCPGRPTPSCSPSTATARRSSSGRPTIRIEAIRCARRPRRTRSASPPTANRPTPSTTTAAGGCRCSPWWRRRRRCRPTARGGTAARN
jgi:hypothetical protein